MMNKNIDLFLETIASKRGILEKKRTLNSPVYFGIMDGVIVADHLSAYLEYTKADLFNCISKISDYCQNELNVGTLFYVEL